MVRCSFFYQALSCSFNFLSELGWGFNCSLLYLLVQLKGSKEQQNGKSNAERLSSDLVCLTFWIFLFTQS